MRAYHLLALVPIATLLAAPFVANRVEPRILGLPFLLAWCVGSVLLASAVMWLIHRLDSARAEPPARGPDDRPAA